MSVEQRPDVLFAQKASAVVKAAGYDPRSMDLKKFRDLSSSIFIRAYQGIYKETLPLLTSVTNDISIEQGLIDIDSRSIDSQLVIDGLINKTRNPVLKQITGRDICEGSHRAIGILVGILFAEGQRLWLEKVEKEKELKKNDIDINNNNNNNNTKQHNIKNLNINTNNNNAENIQAYPPTIPKKFSLNINGKDGEIDLKCNNQPVLKVVTNEAKKLKQKIKILESRLRTTNEDDLANAQLMDNIESGRHISDPVVKKKKKLKKISKKNNNLFVTISDNILNSENQLTLEQSLKADRELLQNIRQKRPSSAPSTRRPTSPSKRDIVHLKIEKNNQQLEQQVPINQKPINYTYDSKSGRKIMLSEAEIISLEQKRNEAMNNIKNMNDIDEIVNSNPIKPRPKSAGFGGRAGAVALIRPSSPERPASPTKPLWPSAGTEHSANQWVIKQKDARDQNKKDKDKEIWTLEQSINNYKHLKKSLNFNIYNQLAKSDLIISIEYCHNCNHHCTTTRHKPEQYQSQANDMLLTISEIFHSNRISVRVGVCNFKANITPTSSTTDVNSRIGAFEIQVGYKNEKGEIYSELLHSKLASRTWPSKTVLEKRIRIWVSKVKIPTYSLSNDDFGFTEKGSDGIGSYPIGVGFWKDISNEYEINHNSNESMPENISKMQWIFDSRGHSFIPKFNVGTKISVSHVMHSNINHNGEEISSGKERYQFIGIVKDNYSQDHLLVQLKYHNNEIKVHPDNCNELKEHNNLMLKHNIPLGKIPKELETLFMLYKTIPTPLPSPLCQLDWLILDDNDNKLNNDILLSRKSFFHQVRKFVWDMEFYYNKNLSDIKHFITGEPIDLQLSYSENTLDWVYSKFSPNNRLANIKKLEQHIFANMPSNYKLKLPIVPAVIPPIVINKPSPPEPINSSNASPRAEFVPSITTVRPQSGTRSPRPVSVSRSRPKSTHMNINNNCNNKDVLSVDEIVEIRYKTSSDWFQGKITKVSNMDENGVLYDVHYDDGDKEMMIRRNKIRRIGDVQIETLTINENIDAFCSTVVSNGILNQKSSCLPGIVKEIYNDNNYCIMFDLGNVGLTGQIVEETIHRSFIISLHVAKQVEIPLNQEGVKLMNNRMNLLTKFEDDSGTDNEKSKTSFIKSPLLEYSGKKEKVIYQVGDVIESYKGKGKWGLGTITDVHDNDTYDVQYEDGENEICQDNDLIRFVTKVDNIQEKELENINEKDQEEDWIFGAKIKVNYLGRGKFFAARLGESCGKDLYTVNYIDGDSEANVPKSRITIVGDMSVSLMNNDEKKSNDVIVTENKGIVESVVGGVMSLFGGYSESEKVKKIIPLIKENKPAIISTINIIPIKNQPIIDNNNQDTFINSNSPRGLDNQDMTRVDSVEGFIINDDNEDDYGEDFEYGEDDFENSGDPSNSNKNRKNSSSTEGTDMNDFIKNM